MGARSVKIGVGGLAAAFLVAVVGYWLLAPGEPVDSDAGQEGTWYPFEVDVWNPPFNQELKRRPGQYIALSRAQKSWRVCVSIPHLKDPYWRAVNFALIDEATRLNIGLRIVEAGGYENLPVQRAQIHQCMNTDADALIIAGISADGLNDLVELYTSRGKPVVDLINGISSLKITARSSVSFYDNGFLTAQYLRKFHEQSARPVRVAWFPGPKGATWVADGDRGFRAGIKNSPIEIVLSAHGDTGRTAQGQLVASALDEHDDLDYIVGTTVTADAAVALLRERQLTDKVKVLSYYYGPGVHRYIRRGHILAAPTDSPTIQSRIAVDQAVRALEGRDFIKHAGPKVILIDKHNIGEVDPSLSLPPKGFRPIFSVNDWGQ